VKKISEFRECTSLCRIEIPSSVEVIGEYGFRGCTSLNEIVFSSDSHVKEVHGFGGSTSLHVVIIHAGCRMKQNKRFRTIKPFLVYDDSDMIASRRRDHLCTFC
jgi:hypothetical protein